MPEKIIKAWHILGRNRKLRDGRIVKDKVWYRALKTDPFTGIATPTNYVTDPIPCLWGMHACRSFNACIQYYQKLYRYFLERFWVCRVEVVGSIIFVPSGKPWPPKILGIKRRILWSVPIDLMSIGYRTVFTYNIDIKRVKPEVRKQYKKKYKETLKERLR